MNHAEITRRPLLLRLAVGVVLSALAIAGGSWLVRGPSTPHPAGSVDLGQPDAVVSIDTPTTDGLLPPDERVAFWEARVAAGGGYLDRIHLADAYVDRTRSTGDLADFHRAEVALADARVTAPNTTLVEVREALIAFSLHDFGGAAQIATNVLEGDPDNLAALTVKGDSLLEMGDVDGAVALYERLGQAAPSAASWSRLGRVAFLRGDADGATSYISRAASAALEAGFPDEVAFFHVQLGDLHRAVGRLSDAERAYATALDALPDHVPALAGLARVREAEGRRAEAITLLERATARLPQPEYIATLGDLHALDGDRVRADEQYALVEAIAGLGAAESVYDRAYVLFAADHDRDVEGAVQRARAELELRADVYGYDALAWALFAAGRVDEAWVAATEATRHGSIDPRIAYHAGMIAAATGRLDEAGDLLRHAVTGSAALPPLQVARAAEALEGLAGAGGPD